MDSVPWLPNRIVKYSMSNERPQGREGRKGCEQSRRGASGDDEEKDEEEEYDEAE